MYHNSAIFVNSLVQLLKCNLSPELHRSQTLTGLKRKAAFCFWYSCTLVIVFRTQLRRSPKCVDVPGISRILTRVLGCYRTLISSLLLRSRDDIREVTPSYLGNILYVVCLYPCHTLWYSVLCTPCTLYSVLPVLCTLYFIVISLLYSASFVVWSRDAGFTECSRFRISSQHGTRLPAGRIPGG